jgi:hypothetical protein
VFLTKRCFLTEAYQVRRERSAVPPALARIFRSLLDSASTGCSVAILFHHLIGLRDERGDLSKACDV